MSLLASLKLVQSTPKAVRLNGINSMRQKLIDRIGDQIAFAQAAESGEVHQRLRFRRLRDVETGEVTEVPSKTRVRAWWAEDKDGSILLWVKYGSLPLELQKGKTAIKLDSKREIVPTLELVRSAVRAGEFDAQIMGAVEGFRSRFKKQG